LLVCRLQSQTGDEGSMMKFGKFAAS